MLPDRTGFRSLLEDMMQPEQVVVDVAQRSGLAFRKGDVQADAVSALRSEALARDLLSIGLHALNAASPDLLRNGEALRNPFLAGCMFDYALEVLPRGSPEMPHVVDADVVALHAELLGLLLPSVEVPDGFVLSVRLCAQKTIDRAELRTRSDMAREGAA